MTLTDEYCLFYLTWIEQSSFWLLARQESFSKLEELEGYAFERVCQKHTHKLTKAFGINGIYSTISSWHHRSKNSDERGVQIDLLIDRSDHVVMICEIKFSRTPFKISKSYATQLQEKVDVFRQFSGTKKSVFLAMITASGLASNDYSTQLIHQQATLEDLF